MLVEVIEELAAMENEVVEEIETVEEEVELAPEQPQETLSFAEDDTLTTALRFMNAGQREELRALVGDLQFANMMIEAFTTPICRARTTP